MNVIESWIVKELSFMTEFDHRILALLKQLRDKNKTGNSNPNLCDGCAVLHQLSYQVNWEQVVMWVDYKPVDVEIEDDNTRKIPVLPSTALSITNLNTPCQKKYFSFAAIYLVYWRFLGSLPVKAWIQIAIMNVVHVRS